MVSFTARSVLEGRSPQRQAVGRLGPSHLLCVRNGNFTPTAVANSDMHEGRGCTVQTRLTGRFWVLARANSP
jgi:hypothetical protein